jgi:hypothetical protein|tara:strand:- start:19 stop:249 length:231 start_codon:yes stop_codon:yes gene_type:complete
MYGSCSSVGCLTKKGESRSRVKSNDDSWYDSITSVTGWQVTISPDFKFFNFLFLLVDLIMGFDKMINNKGVIWTKN